MDTNRPPDAGLVLVPHTHWDREWYEPHDVFRLRLVHVLDDVLDRLDHDPEFRFTLDGQAMAIEDYLQMRPASRARVERLVVAGRLAIGPFLILLDEFGCDGETMVRNLELGTAAAGRLGAVMQVGYLPDMFGHTAQMPQVLRGFGIEHAALWRGVPDAVREHAFTWVAPDGSEVRTEYLFDGYGSALDMFAVPGQLAEQSTRYRDTTRSWYGEEPVVGMLGTDHSAPAADLMDRVRAHNVERAASGAPALRVVTLGEHLLSRSADRELRSRVRGELRSHARGNLLPGVFSIRTNLKAEMARAELVLTRAERLDALWSTEDHRAFFDLAWQRVVESSAHDSITGCGIDDTADQVSARLGSAAHIGRAVSERVAASLADAVPADAHLVLNTLPWARTVQAEMVVTPDEVAEPPAGTQVLTELRTALGDELLPSEDLVRLLRRIHGRELFGQQITGYRWGEGTLEFEVAEVPDGTFDLAALTAEIDDAMSAPGAAARTWRVVTTARPRRRLLVEVEVPPLGHTSVRPADYCGLLSRAPVSADGTSLRNDLVSVEVDPDGTLSVTGTDGTVLHGVGRLVDEGDRGDSYNFGPVAGSPPIGTPAQVEVEVVATGPVRGVLSVEREYDLPVGVDPLDRDQRLAGTARLRTRTLVELRAGEPFVRLTVDLLNTVGDHRLRLHVPLGEVVRESYGAGQFDVTRRGRTAEGGWGEHPLPTFPATGFVSAGRAHVLLAKLTEYEVVTPTAAAGGDELALTLLRAVGMMSVNVHPLRDEPAGSELPVPGAQYIGAAVSTRLAVLPSAAGWEQAEVARWAEVFRHEALVCRGGAARGGPLPPAVTGPALEGPAVLTSLRRVGSDDDGHVLEARLVSVSDADAEVSLLPLAGRRWVATDLSGRPTGPDPDPATGRTTLPAWTIRTLRTTRSDVGSRT